MKKLIIALLLVATPRHRPPDQSAAEGVRLDADEGLWEGIEEEVQGSIDEFNGYVEAIRNLNPAAIIAAQARAKAMDELIAGDADTI